MYDLDSPVSGLRECPHCRFTMERLSQSPVLDRDFGYVLDCGVWWDPDDHILSSMLVGDPCRWFWRHVLEPLAARFFGRLRNLRYRRVLRRYPHSQICPHCHYVVRQK